MRNTHGRRWGAAVASAAALVMLTATGAQAASASSSAGAAKPTASYTGSVSTQNQAGNANNTGGGVQGWQLCLLASCQTGTGGSGGAQGVQGINLCLLALCSVRG
ncbi:MULTISPECIES: hypothetical protein [unclassified Streptomyces]|uniref:hypothetical protein n=1 Tax=unclassified Streptomyces TaxID=2593676 RepID=UPI0011AFFDD4|nr:MULTISPECIES: hypothetical protein [unclassified Streptomyces]